MSRQLPPRPALGLSGGSVAAGESRPFRVRLGFTFAVIAAIHLVALGLLFGNAFGTGAGAVTLSAALFAYGRGAMHSMDFDHVSMIDNSTRKFVAEGRRPASVGLAFSAGHSTVVLAMGILVVSGSGLVSTLLDENSVTARILGIVGLSVSGLYLLLVAVNNSVTFWAAWTLRRGLRADPEFPVPADAFTPRGPAARLMAAPLRRVRHPRHIYGLGFLFGLGFDTASTIGLVMVTGAAGIAGAPPLALLSLPLLFAAAMTLGDTINGLMMLKMYQSADADPLRKINYNLVVTGISVLSALTVGVLAAASLLADEAGVGGGLLTAMAGVDTEYFGYILAGIFAVIGTVAALRWRSRRADRGATR
ncbi:HoxN/HupN/NixA family nickel/cobalt transporter [Nakamurella lactea]|uniref:HoxN/HupN/NixA family nickel/cobalt transporter n=1 Tax=Nakamurella lactea TaxID=459515 RepID=UPI001378A98B|nr:nickel transporter [Nakamurella lactea]